MLILEKNDLRVDRIGISDKMTRNLIGVCVVRGFLVADSLVEAADENFFWLKTNLSRKQHCVVLAEDFNKQAMIRVQR